MQPVLCPPPLGTHNLTKALLPSTTSVSGLLLLDYRSSSPVQLPSIDPPSHVGPLACETGAGCGGPHSPASNDLGRRVERTGQCHREKGRKGPIVKTDEYRTGRGREREREREREGEGEREGERERERERGREREREREKRESHEDTAKSCHEQAKVRPH